MASTSSGRPSAAARAGADSHGHESVRERRESSPYRDRILTLPHISDLEALMHVASIKSDTALPL